MRTTQRLLAVAAVAALLVGGLVHLFWPGRGDHTATARFTSGVGIYAGDDVRVLGVSVGSVEEVTTEPDSVAVTIRYRDDLPLPADVHAAVLAPTLVTGRYVQLAPVAHGDGPRLADGAEIPVERTAVPVEWDQITSQLKTVTRDLGPEGANANGALSRFLDTGAANLQGQGGNLHDTVEQLSQAVTTLSDGRDDLFDTVRNLQTFVGMLARSDEQVRQFSSRLASVSGVLDENKHNLSTTLNTLDRTLPVVQKFVADNRDRFATDLDKLSHATGTLSDNRQALADVLQIAPAAVSNFNNIFDPVSQSLTGVLALTNTNDPAAFVCSALLSAGGTPEQCREGVAPLASLAQMDNLPIRANPLDRNGRSQQVLPDGSPAPSPGEGPGLLGLERLITPGGS